MPVKQTDSFSKKGLGFKKTIRSVIEEMLKDPLTLPSEFRAYMGRSVEQLNPAIHASSIVGWKQIGGIGGSSAGVGLLPTGSLVPFVSETPPEGFLLCNGQAVSRTTYAGLFALLGTTYGAGDGSTTFNVPNLKGRVVVGVDPADPSWDNDGDVGGAKAHTLAESEMPSHTHVFAGDALAAHNHTQDPHDHGLTQLGSSANTTATGGATRVERSGGLTDRTNNATAVNQAASAGTPSGTNAATGGGGGHNNVQPYMALSYIIKT